ncbi:beta-lactamase superfamily II metal-dependent hydrolase [Bradyrhizobium sp. USDA 377]
MPGSMLLRIWDVEHGACAMLHHTLNGVAGRLAMIDSGDTHDWTPADFITRNLARRRLDYLFITNADQDHMSGLQGLWDAGIEVPVMHHNPTFGPQAFEAVKRQSGPLTRDAQRYMQNIGTFTAPIDYPFNTNMGGITATMFYNAWPVFQKTNDLSLVVFIKYGPFGILFPGDLEGPGWRNHLLNPSFRAMLADVDVLVASHHGRDNGYCEDVFAYCHPMAVVMSDKAIVHDTQNMIQAYRSQVVKRNPNGVLVRTSGLNRRVLTTRKDGWIQFEVDDQGNFNIDTEYRG